MLPPCWSMARKKNLTMAMSTRLKRISTARLTITVHWYIWMLRICSTIAAIDTWKKQYTPMSPTYWSLLTRTKWSQNCTIRQQFKSTRANHLVPYRRTVTPLPTKPIAIWKCSVNRSQWSSRENLAPAKLKIPSLSSNILLKQWVYIHFICLGNTAMILNAFNTCEKVLREFI